MAKKVILNQVIQDVDQIYNDSQDIDDVAEKLKTNHDIEVDILESKIKTSASNEFTVILDDGTQVARYKDFWIAGKDPQWWVFKMENGIAEPCHKG